MRLGVYLISGKFWAVRGRLTTALGGALGTPENSQADKQTTGPGGVGRNVRAALSRPPPPTNCAAASTGACLESGGVDNDCCARCDDAACAPGYTYAGQVVFDEDMLLSTYPDFFPFCDVYLRCGNTCCVPVETNETARVAAGG